MNIHEGCYPQWGEFSDEDRALIVAMAVRDYVMRERLYAALHNATPIAPRSEQRSIIDTMDHTGKLWRRIFPRTLQPLESCHEYRHPHRR